MFIRRKCDWKQEYFYVCRSERVTAKMFAEHPNFNVLGHHVTIADVGKALQGSYFIGTSIDLDRDGWLGVLEFLTDVSYRRHRRRDWKPLEPKYLKQIITAVDRYAYKHSLHLSDDSAIVEAVRLMRARIASRARAERRREREFTERVRREAESTWSKGRVDHGSTGWHPSQRAAADLEAAYKRLARLHHPDLGGTTEAMQDLNLLVATARRA
jgi:hypothetical protein